METEYAHLPKFYTFKNYTDKTRNTVPTWNTEQEAVKTHKSDDSLPKATNLRTCSAASLAPVPTRLLTTDN